MRWRPSHSKSKFYLLLGIAPFVIEEKLAAASGDLCAVRDLLGLGLEDAEAEAEPAPAAIA